MFAFVEAIVRSFHHPSKFSKPATSAIDGEGLYEIGFRDWGAAYQNLKRQLREYGILKGAVRAFFQQTSGLGYVLSQHPQGGWEFVDYLFSHRRRGLLDRLFVESRWAWGIRHRARIVCGLLAKSISELRAQDGQLVILDLGCGPGSLALRAVELGGDHIRVVGVDHDPRAIRIALSRRDQRGLNGQIRFERRDAFQYLAGAQESFDLVLVIGLIAYLSDDEAIELLRRARRRLRGGGRIITNNTSTQTNPLFLQWLHLMGLKGLRARSADELRSILTGAGYERIRLITDPSGTQHIATGEVSSSSAGAYAVEFLPISKLRDHEEVEPQRVQKLAREIQRSGHVVPILVEKNYNIVLDGHHRKEALKCLGFKKIPCLRADYAHVQLGSWRSGFFITKEEVIRRALIGERFPPKTTRHIHDFEMKEVELEMLKRSENHAGDDE